MNRCYYSESHIYERFIIESLGCTKGSKYGADSSFLKNAISSENGETFTKHLGSFEKQFRVLKNHILFALKRRFESKQIDTISYLSLINRLDECTKTVEIVELIETVLNK